MNDLLLDQYRRLLASLPQENPWRALEESGFLDLLRAEADGGAGLPLEELFPLALETGMQAAPPPVIEAMAARIADPVATDTPDAEQALSRAGLGRDRARALAATLAAGQMAGAMTHVQNMTIEYALTRQQFGREIAKFQAVQHQIAVMAEEVMAARIATEAAFVGVPLEIAEKRAAVAKLRAGQAALVVCSVAHAVHGAIGVSQEYPLHLYTQRLHRWRLAHGGESWWARKLGEWVLADTRDAASLVRAL